MPDNSATAIAHPNIAFIKYWGNRDERLRIPANGSISMNLDGLDTRTRVALEPDLSGDQLRLNGAEAGGEALRRVSSLLEDVRQMAGLRSFAGVESENNFPTGTGIASSASGFAALALAASRAAGLTLDERSLSRLARRASGSACRSVPGGYVEWQTGSGEDDSYAFSIAPAAHWDLADCIAILSREHKPVTSQAGHALAGTSPLQSTRVSTAVERLELCRRAILGRDFELLALVMELDSNMMHAVMQTGTPPLLYWLPGTLRVMLAVQEWRRHGLPVCYTIDAGPNVHVICPADHASDAARRLSQLEGVQQVLTALPGGPARLAEETVAQM